MLDDIKLDFGLPASASLSLFNIVGNYSVCGSTAGILWALNDAKVPKYRIVVRGETSEVMLFEFSSNVLAGIVASALFIQDEKLLQERIAICVTIIIILKVMLTSLVYQITKEDWVELLTMAPLSPPTPMPIFPLHV
ncbi:unnamed protein product [Rotaria magnacalcarata]|uniref:Uncharacterized protein n=1 Tax=Rotaria magnacalcarata TaxID=392030 RepID=A0A815PJ59_9BILA|nr:unnamed protein product [Rotaria magnacalcarata]CAF1449857.1 unnamed protein product [Rotaria magnacalcarata]